MMYPNGVLIYIVVFKMVLWWVGRLLWQGFNSEKGGKKKWKQRNEPKLLRPIIMMMGGLPVIVNESTTLHTFSRKSSLVDWEFTSIIAKTKLV